MLDAHAEKSRRQMQPVQQRSSDGARPRTARRLPGRPVLKPVVPASETLARSTPFRNSSRNSTSPHQLTSTRSLTTTWGTQQGNALLEPALRLRLPYPALPCPALALPHSNPRHFHLTSRPSVQPPCSCCCSVFEDHLALALRPPPPINALPTHPYLVSHRPVCTPTTEASPAVTGAPCLLVFVLMLAGVWVCALGHRPSDLPGTIAWHGIASRPIASQQQQQHPIPSHRIGFDLSFDTCAVVLCVCYAVWLCGLALARTALAAALPPHAPLDNALATYMLPAVSNLQQVCYRTEVFDSA